MRLTISAQGDHEPKGMHLVMVDGRCMLLDLSQVQGSLHDAAINQVEWGQVRDGPTVRPGGTITRVDGSNTPFFDKAAALPYITAFEAEWARRESEHQTATAEATTAAEAVAAAEAESVRKAQAKIKAEDDARAAQETQAIDDVRLAQLKADADAAVARAAVEQRQARETAEAEAVAQAAAEQRARDQAAFDATAAKNARAAALIGRRNG